MLKVDYPYCDEEMEIDDGGYEEDEIYQEQCPECEKNFVYTTSVSYFCNAEKAPYLNDDGHKWKKIIGIPAKR